MNMSQLSNGSQKDQCCFGLEDIHFIFCGLCPFRHPSKPTLSGQGVKIEGGFQVLLCKPPDAGDVTPSLIPGMKIRKDLIGIFALGDGLFGLPYHSFKIHAFCRRGDEYEV